MHAKPAAPAPGTRGIDLHHGFRRGGGIRGDAGGLTRGRAPVRGTQLAAEGEVGEGDRYVGEQDGKCDAALLFGGHMTTTVTASGSSGRDVPGLLRSSAQLRIAIIAPIRRQE